MATLPRPAEMRTPFLSIAQAAFFLQVKHTQARYLYDIGRLPRVQLDDGAEFQLIDKVWISATGLWPLLDPWAKAVFADWQRGIGDLPRLDRQDVPPPLESLTEPRSHRGG